MKISVIIPVLNEGRTIADTLRALMSLKPDEVIVVDGGSSDKTQEMAAGFDAQVLTSQRGRAKQMNCGAAAASGDVLLFLHADTRLPQSAFADISDALEAPNCVGGRFDVKLEGEHWMLKVVGAMVNCRSRLTKSGTGDQAIFVRRETFEAMSGYPDIPLMEDLALCRGLKRTGRIACLRSQVVTSARRWESDGLWRTIVRMWILKLLYLGGVSPARLKQFYGDTR